MSSTQSLVTHAAIGLALSVTSIGVGYHLGSLFPCSFGSGASKTASGAPVAPVEPEKELEEETEDADGIPDGDLAAVRAGFMEPCKLVLVVRTDLKLKPGDIASQCCQGTLSCYKALVKTNKSLVQHWERTGQAKIALKAKDEDQLQELEAIAKSLNLCARSIRAHGIDGVTNGTPTIVAIGPAPVNLINEVTGKLRLL